MFHLAASKLAPLAVQCHETLAFRCVKSYLTPKVNTNICFHVCLSFLWCCSPSLTICSVLMGLYRYCICKFSICHATVTFLCDIVLFALIVHAIIWGKINRMYYKLKAMEIACANWLWWNAAHDQEIFSGWPNLGLLLDLPVGLEFHFGLWQHYTRKLELVPSMLMVNKK